MSGRQLQALFAEHGGVTRIHVTPVRGGWQNVYVCADEFARRLTAREERMLASYLERSSV